jgi:Ala-tRNA(Pro) deacylase
MASLGDSLSPGRDRVTEMLDARGIEYDVIEHAETYTALADANAARLDPGAVGKTLVLHDRDGYTLVVVPADRHLDLARVRELTGHTHRLRLATESEIARDFPLYEVGAVPPIGPTVPPVEIIDVRLLEHQRGLFACGDHRHALLMPVTDLLRVAEPRVAEVCAEGSDEKEFHH